MSAVRKLVATLVAVAASASVAAAGEQLVGVRADNAVVTFDSTSPSTFATVVPVTGLPANEILVGTAVRPTDGVLFAVGSTNRVYQIAPDTGFAAPVGGFAFSPPLDGTDFGVAFDLAGDTLRVTSDTGQNLVLDPLNGTATSVDGPLRYASGDANAGAAASVVAIAWQKSTQTGPRLYGIDLARGLLVWIDNPSLGSVRTVGPLNVGALTTGGYTGLDISTSSGVAFAELAPQAGTVSRLYAVNLASGLAVPVGGAMTALVRGASIVPSAPPAPVGTQLVTLVYPNHLYTVTTDRPNRVQRTVHVKGLPLNDSFLGVAVRPKNGVLYGLTRTALYDIDQGTATASRVGIGFQESLPIGPMSCDFDPLYDKLRVVGSLGTNQQVDADTGTLVDANVTTLPVDLDAPPAFAAGDPRQGATPTLGAIAFTGRDKPGTFPKAYVLETNSALLARLGDPLNAPGETRDGKVFSIGLLGIPNVNSLPPGRALATTSSRTGYAAVQSGSSASILYHVDLTNGRATLVGGIAAPGVVQAMTFAPTTNPPRAVVRVMRLVLNFKKPALDSATIVGSVPNPPGGLLGKVVTVDIGGVSKTFTLDAKGRGKIGKYASMRIAGSSAKGLAWTLSWKRETLVPSLLDEQMTGLVFAKREPRQIEVKVTMDGVTYRTLVDLAYTAKPGRSGSAVTN